MAKRLGTTYRPGARSKDWRKVKNRITAEVVIGGYTPGGGNRSSKFGALLVGRPVDGVLAFAGGVGTGFTQQRLDELMTRLRGPADRRVPVRPSPADGVPARRDVGRAGPAGARSRSPSSRTTATSARPASSTSSRTEPRDPSACCHPSACCGDAPRWHSDAGLAGVTSRADAEALDAADPLAPWRERFVTPDGLVYLDGNSLGMAPVAALERLADVAATDWAQGLIRSWDHWLDLPRRVGDRLAPIIGAPAGSVVVHDSTTVNLYQLVHAGLAVAAGGGGRTGRSPSTTATSRPTATSSPASPRRPGGPCATGSPTSTASPSSCAPPSTTARRPAPTSPPRPPGPRRRVRSRCGTCRTPPAPWRSTSWPTGSSWPSGARTSSSTAGRARRRGRTWRPELVASIEQPIWGWFAQAAQFEMGARHDPQPDVRRLLLGTPGILGLATAEVGIGHVADAGMAAVAAKGRALTGLALELLRRARARLADAARPDGPRRPRGRAGRRRRRRPRRADPPRRDHRRPPPRRHPPRLRRADHPLRRRLGRRRRPRRRRRRR